MKQTTAIDPVAASPGFCQRVFSKPNLKTLWLPLLAALLAAALTVWPYRWNLRWLGAFMGVASLAGLLWFLMLAMARLCQKRVAAGFAALACLGLVIVALLAAMFVGMGVSEDGFANGLTLPKGIELAEPGRHLLSNNEAGDPADTFQAAIRAALAVPGSAQAGINLGLPSLARLRKEHPQLLDRYLAAHPGWRVYEESWGRFATRRWMIGDHWQMSRYGNYSSFNRKEGPRYQTRTSIRFSGETRGPRGQRILPNTPEGVAVDRENDLWQSVVQMPVGDLLLEQLEQSDAIERRITRAALVELEREFAALAVQPTWDNAKRLLPEGAVICGDSAIELSGWGGIYNAAIRCNPRQPGRVYLKAFEITRACPLSADRLKSSTNEWVGWSDEPAEKFLSETQFTIYEGDWEQYYGARFEVWFIPADGGAERKLLERDFKIEGWMR